MNAKAVGAGLVIGGGLIAVGRAAFAATSRREREAELRALIALQGQTLDVNAFKDLAYKAQRAAFASGTAAGRAMARNVVPDYRRVAPSIPSIGGSLRAAFLRVSAPPYSADARAQGTAQFTIWKYLEALTSMQLALANVLLPDFRLHPLTATVPLPRWRSPNPTEANEGDGKTTSFVSAVVMGRPEWVPATSPWAWFDAYFYNPVAITEYGTSGAPSYADRWDNPWPTFRCGTQQVSRGSRWRGSPCPDWVVWRDADNDPLDWMLHPSRQYYYWFWRSFIEEAAPNLVWAFDAPCGGGGQIPDAINTLTQYVSTPVAEKIADELTAAGHNVGVAVPGWGDVRATVMGVLQVEWYRQALVEPCPPPPSLTEQITGVVANGIVAGVAALALSVSMGGAASAAGLAQGALSFPVPDMTGTPDGLLTGILDGLDAVAAHGADFQIGGILDTHLALAESGQLAISAEAASLTVGVDGAVKTFAGNLPTVALTQSVAQASQLLDQAQTALASAPSEAQASARQYVTTADAALTTAIAQATRATQVHAEADLRAAVAAGVQSAAIAAANARQALTLLGVGHWPGLT